MLALVDSAERDTGRPGLVRRRRGRRSPTPSSSSEWLGEDAEVDLRPGGDLTIRVDDGERSGFVEEVDEPRRLVFWWSADDEESSRVEIELEPAARRHPGAGGRVAAAARARAVAAASAPELCAIA